MSQPIVKFTAHAQRRDFNRGVDVYLYRARMSGGVEINEIVEQPTFVVTRDEGLAYNPTFQLDKETAQSLMDALWMAGLRPNNGEASDAQVTAIKRHLEDMRAFAFAKSEVAKP